MWYSHESIQIQKNQLQRQCPIDENECLFKTSNLTVKTEVIYRYIFWTNSSFSNTFKCVLEQNASSFMDALTRLRKQCKSEIVVYPLSYVFTVILVFLVFLHHILVWLICNIIVAYSLLNMYFGQFAVFWSSTK